MYAPHPVSFPHELRNSSVSLFLRLSVFSPDFEGNQRRLRERCRDSIPIAAILGDNISRPMLWENRGMLRIEREFTLSSIRRCVAFCTKARESREHRYRSGL